MENIVGDISFRRKHDGLFPNFTKIWKGGHFTIKTFQILKFFHIVELQKKFDDLQWKMVVFRKIFNRSRVTFGKMKITKTVKQHFQQPVYCKTKKFVIWICHCFAVLVLPLGTLIIASSWYLWSWKYQPMKWIFDKFCWKLKGSPFYGQ